MQRKKEKPYIKFTIIITNIINVRLKKKRERQQQQRKSGKSIEKENGPHLLPGIFYSVTRHISFVVSARSLERIDQDSRRESSKFRREWSFPAKENATRYERGRVKGHHPRFQQGGGRGVHSAAPTLQPPPFGRRLPSIVHLTRALSGRTVHCRIESSGLEYSQGWPMVSGHYCWTGACAI